MRHPRARPPPQRFPVGFPRAHHAAAEPLAAACGCRPPDEDISPLHTMQGPITRARARQLDLQVRSNLVNCFSELTLGSMHVLLIRNNGENQQGLGEGQGLKEEVRGRPHQGGVHVQLDFDSTSDSRTLLHQN
jgi:hypothetical protein